MKDWWSYGGRGPTKEMTQGWDRESGDGTIQGDRAWGVS